MVACPGGAVRRPLESGAEPQTWEGARRLTEPPQNTWGNTDRVNLIGISRVAAATRWRCGRGTVTPCVGHEFGKRLTGVSTPFVGASWETVPNVEEEVLTRLVTFLEDRRVLYDPTEVEIPPRCVNSVLRIREVLVDLAGRLPRDSEVAATLRAMAGACRGFLDRLPDEMSPGRLGHPSPTWGYPSWVFQQALGVLRGQLGLYLQELVDHRGVHISGELATILPPAPDSAP